MKDEMNNLIKQRMHQDAIRLKNQSKLDVKDQVMLKIKAQNNQKMKTEKQSFISTLFTSWKIPAAVSLIVLTMVSINYFNIYNSNPIPDTAKDNNLIAHHDVTPVSEKQALTNDLVHLSKIFDL